MHHAATFVIAVLFIGCGRRVSNVLNALRRLGCAVAVAPTTDSAARLLSAQAVEFDVVLVPDDSSDAAFDEICRLQEMAPYWATSVALANLPPSAEVRRAAVARRVEFVRWQGGIDRLIEKLRTDRRPPSRLASPDRLSAARLRLPFFSSLGITSQSWNFPEARAKAVEQLDVEGVLRLSQGIVVPRACRRTRTMPARLRYPKCREAVGCGTCSTATRSQTQSSFSAKKMQDAESGPISECAKEPIDRDLGRLQHAISVGAPQPCQQAAKNWLPPPIPARFYLADT